MLRRLKHVTLSTLQNLGGFRLASISNWRRQRLLILCYHGLALKDEDQWCPGLYITPQLFQARMDALSRERCSVLSLREGVERLYQGDLPNKSVAITFDDGFYDFYKLAFPVLRKHGYPATVYQTTYYMENRFPVFNLVLDYLFWQAARKTLDGRAVGIHATLDLTDRGRAVDAIVRYSFQQNYCAAEKDAMAAQIAGELQIDYEEIRGRHILQLMSSTQVGEISKAGVDVELHTHRHRTPENEALFVREIRDNREAIRRSTGKDASHFCYPSGICRDMFVPWIRNQNVVSATTCAMGLASPNSNRLLLPRLLDTTGISQLEFEGWLAGLCAWMPRFSAAKDGPTPVPYWEMAPQASKVTSA